MMGALMQRLESKEAQISPVNLQLTAKDAKVT
jgi:hypothetical protein